MSTIAKIFIAVIFVISATFLGFSISAVAQADDNPKFQYMRELRNRQVIEFDCDRLIEDIKKERQNPDSPSARITEAVEQLQQRREILQRQVETADAEGAQTLDQINDRLDELDEVELQVSNFTATMKAYREALASLERRYANLQDLYQDVVRQYESLAIEKIRMDVERERILEDHRAIEEAFLEAQDENQALQEVINMLLHMNPNLPTLIRDRGPQIDGVVTAVANGYVAISVGSQQGVARGQRFAVTSSNGTYKARIHIIRVDLNSAIGAIEEQDLGVNITEQDRVSRSSILFRPISGEPRNRAQPAGR